MYFVPELIIGCIKTSNPVFLHENPTPLELGKNPALRVWFDLTEAYQAIKVMGVIHKGC